MKYFNEIIQIILDPGSSPTTIITIFALGTMIVAAMSVYAAIVTIQASKKKR